MTLAIQDCHNTFCYLKKHFFTLHMHMHEHARGDHKRVLDPIEEEQVL